MGNTTVRGSESHSSLRPPSRSRNYQNSYAKTLAASSRLLGDACLIVTRSFATAEIKSPDLNLVLQRLEEVQHQDPARSRPYEVRREYKVFRGFDKQPTSEVMAQINFVPPDMKTYKIIKALGNSRGEKIVRELLDRETESAKKGLGSEITRANYDFVFLRQENFGVVPEYVLRIVPKRKDKYLLRGQIWVDASTFRIRRIEGVPAKSPSLWIKGIHITLQYAELGGMWVPISFDAIATVRFLGEYTLAGLNIQADPLSTAPNSHRAITSGIVNDATEAC